MAYSKFDMLSMTMRYYEKSLEEEIMETRREFHNAANGWVKSAIASKEAKLRKTRDKILNEYKDDICGCFDELGITCQVVDEGQHG